MTTVQPLSGSLNCTIYNGWYHFEIGSREEGGLVIESLADGMACAGYESADITKMRKLCVRLLGTLHQAHAAMPCAGCTEIHYRLSRQYLQLQVDCAPLDMGAERPAPEFGPARSVGIMLLRGGYTVWNEYGRWGDDLRLRSQRLIP